GPALRHLRRQQLRDGNRDRPSRLRRVDPSACPGIAPPAAGRSPMMTSPPASERSLTISTGQRELEGLLVAPAAATRAGAVLCHPHPEYGGSMENPVVVTVAAALVAGGFATLRFNFGGV